jgi:hypothetical protein
MLPRKTTPRVKGGRVQKKDREGRTAPDGYTLGASLQTVRHAPGPGHVHVLDEHDVRRFLDLLPDWSTLGRGIHAIVLDRADDFDGCYRHDGVIMLASWPEEMVRDFYLPYFEEHREVLERIGVPWEIVTPPAPERASEPDPGGLVPPDSPPAPYARCWFEPHTARDYLLMHVFLHELGHHHDHRTLRRSGSIPRGEDYAEAWAIERERALWPRYRAWFACR